MRKFSRHIKSLCLAVSLIIITSHVSAEELEIPPVYQKTMVWCWAAVSEMVLKYYDVPNLNPAGDYQCGVVGSLGGVCSANCGWCITPIGSTFQMANVLRNYQNIVRQYGLFGFQSFRASAVGRLNADDIEDEIDSSNPVIVGISPSGMGRYYTGGMSEHVALIVGYEYNGGNLWLKVNDPMPYGLVGYDPYIAADAQLDQRGSYWITYNNLVRYLGYKDTIIIR
jgi:hypothetical protein